MTKIRCYRAGCQCSTPRSGVGVLFCLAGMVLVLAGCTATHYRRSADRQVYQTISQAQQKVLGKTNAFTIDTPYSQRDPQTIPPQELIEDRLRTNQRVLTVEAALNLAVAQSRRYQDQKELLYQKAMNVTAARHDFRPNLFASSVGRLRRSSNGERSGSLNSQAGVDQLLKTGGSLSLNVLNDLFRYYTGDPRRSAISTLSVNLVQPLLRGFGPNNQSVESLTQTERDLIYGIRSYSHFQNTYAVEIVNDYFNLLAQKDGVRNRYTNYLSRVQSTRRLEARQADREKTIDVDQTRQAELAAQNNYINAVANYENALNDFKIKLGLPIGVRVQLEDQPLVELQKLGPLPVMLPKEEAYRLAVARQMEILNAIDRYEDRKRKIKVAANQLKADLILRADSSLESEGPTDYTRFDRNKVNAGVGLELNLPFDRLRERNNYRAALIAFEAELRTLILTLDTLRDNIDSGLRTLIQRQQNYQIQQGALEVANRRVASATMSLEAGRVEVRDLVEAQDAQISAQNAVTSALVAYQQALLQLLLDIGVLDTQPANFWIKDHLAAHFKVEAKPVPKAAPVEIITPEKLFGN